MKKTVKLWQRPADESRPVKKQAKRLRHVFDNPAHVWAHPLQKDGSGFEQTDARNAQGNWYFKTLEDGTRVMYSYRDSYPIGSRFEQGRKTVFLLRSGKPYSVTTAKHMNYTRGAVPDKEKNVEVFTVPCMTQDFSEGEPGKAAHATNLAAYVSSIISALETYASARSSWKLTYFLKEARDLRAEAKRYAKFFRVKLPELPSVPRMDYKKLAKITERERIRDEKRDAKRKAANEAWEKAHAETVAAWENGPEACTHIGKDGTPEHWYSSRYECTRQREREDWEKNRVERIAAWKRGENVKLPVRYDEPALFRVRNGIERAEVETSQGAIVPVSGKLGAARLFRFLLSLKEAGRTYQKNGHGEHIGAFTVTSFAPITGTMSPSGEVINSSEWLLVAGCHRIMWSEILTIAPAVMAAEQAELNAENYPMPVLDSEGYVR
jgi:hypothetical protein